MQSADNVVQKSLHANPVSESPKGTSIERTDVNGNYEPSNCVWLPSEKQNANRRCSATPTQAEPKLKTVIEKEAKNLPSIRFRAQQLEDLETLVEQDHEESMSSLVRRAVDEFLDRKKTAGIADSGLVLR